MKIVLEIPVPKYREREVRIADQIDHDAKAIMSMAIDFLVPEEGEHVVAQVKYDPVMR